MEVKKFLEMLENEGLEATETTANKYGYEEKAIMIGNKDKSIRPLVYERQIIDMKEENAMEFINANLKKVPNLDVKDVMTRDYILENVRCAIRHRTDDDSILKVPVRGDLELYYNVKIDSSDKGTASFKLREEMINNLNISRLEINEVAKKNTAREARIRSMYDTLNEMTDGMLGDEVPEGSELYVATNVSKTYGAAVMECKDLLDDFCRSKGFKGVAIIPSSIHEVLLMPVTEDMNTEEMNKMVRAVNSTELAPEDVLSDHIYFNYI